MGERPRACRENIIIKLPLTEFFVETEHNQDLFNKFVSFLVV